jgi:hypothetical protein
VKPSHRPPTSAAIAGATRPTIPCSVLSQPPTSAEVLDRLHDSRNEGRTRIMATMSEQVVAEWDKQVQQWHRDNGAPTSDQIAKAEALVDAFMKRQAGREARRVA